MARLADLNLPNNIVYDERTKRYHDMLQNYRMVGASRVAAMGTPQRADRSDQYITRQEFFTMRNDLYRFISHITELTRGALEAIFEIQKNQSRNTEHLIEYERDNREEDAEKKSSLIRRLTRGAMERVGSKVRANPGLTLMSILGTALIGFLATPNETVQRFGNSIDELVNTITSMTDIFRQIAIGAGILGGILGGIGLARSIYQRFSGTSRQIPTRPGSGAAPAGSRPGAPSAPRSSVPSTPSPSSPSSQPGSLSRFLNSRMMPAAGPLAAATTAVQMANANQMLRQGTINREEHRRMAGAAMGSMLGLLIPGIGFIGGMALSVGGMFIGREIAEIINRSQRPPPTPEQRNQQAAAEEQRLRERAANTPPGSLERRSLARVEAQNMIRVAQQENRLTRQQAQAISIEMGRGGRYQNRHEEVSRALREGGNLEISPEVARRLNLPSQATQPGVRPSITIMPPVNVPAQRQQQSTPRQQSQSPAVGLQIRNPEQAMLEALMRQALPS